MKKTSLQSFHRYAYIDALRGWAIIGVLFAHLALVGNVTYPSWLYKIATVYIGPRGVQLFFVVSAFTLCLSWYNRKQKEKHVLKNFYIRRFFRIAPLFYVALIYFLYIQGFWGTNPNNYSLNNILATIFFLNGFSPAWINNIVYGGWTIAVEMTFYAIFPFLVSKIKSVKTALIILFISILSMQAIRLWLTTLPVLQKNYSTFSFEFFPSQLPVFLIGITVFLILNVSWSKKIVKTAAIVFVAILFIQYFFHVPLIAGHYLYGIFFGALLLFLAKYPIKLLVNPVITYIGKVSYSMYLSHVAILWILGNLGLVNMFGQFPVINFFYKFLLLLIATTGVSSILFFGIERPGQLLGKKLIDKREEKTTLDINVSTQTW